MSRWTVRLWSADARRRACEAIMHAPAGAFAEIREDVRSGDQNRALWAALTDLSQQLEWHGAQWTPEDWKDFFMDALATERARFMPREDGGTVRLGRRTSKLTKAEFSDLLEVVKAFGARHGVTFSDEGQVAA